MASRIPVPDNIPSIRNSSAILPSSAQNKRPAQGSATAAYYPASFMSSRTAIHHPASIEAARRRESRRKPPGRSPAENLPSRCRPMSGRFCPRAGCPLADISGPRSTLAMFEAIRPWLHILWGGIFLLPLVRSRRSWVGVPIRRDLEPIRFWLQGLIGIALIIGGVAEALKHFHAF